VTDEPPAPDEPATRYRTRVRPEWVDYNGHMSEAYYVLVFGYATDALLDDIGMDAAYRDRTGTSLYTLEAHLCYLAEVGADEPLRVTTHVLGVDRKRLHLFHALRHGGHGDLLATEELLLCHVDTAAGRSAPLPADLADALHALRAAQGTVPVDERVGRAIRLPR
jgi:acyl-CoA thioester hydrolase